MIVQTVEIYKVDGKEFRSLDKVREYLENQIGGIIDIFLQGAGNVKPEVRLKLLKNIIDNPTQVKCLSLLADNLPECPENN